MPTKKMARGVRINVDGSAEFVYYDNDRSRISEFLNNGYAEGIYFGSSLNTNSAHAYVDEDGIRKGLPVNFRATKICTNLFGALTVDILGPMVMFSSNGEGEEADLRKNFIDAIEAEGGKIRETGS